MIGTYPHGSVHIHLAYGQGCYCHLYRVEIGMMTCVRVVGLKLMCSFGTGVSSLLIQVRCHPFFVRVVVVVGMGVLFRVLVCRGQPSASRESRKLTSVWRGIFFRVDVFLVWVVIGEPVFGCSTKLGTEVD